MSSHRTRAVSRPPSASDLVSFHFKGEKGPAGVPESEFNGGRNAVCLLREGFRRTLHVGLGSRGRFGSDVLRQAAGVAARTLLRIGRERLAFDARSFASDAQAVVEGAWLASYKFEDFKAASARRQHALKSVEVWVGSRDLRTAADGARVGAEMAEATNLTRQVGNQPPNVMSPARLADEARRLARQLKLRCRVWDERALRREGFGGICAVGQGSANPPRLILLDMPAPNRNAPTVVVVGKAITFDTGGISIKPADRMEEMKWDKMGGCAVLGIMQAARRLKIPVRLIGLIPSAENMPSASAYRPSDLVRTWDGKVIEVLNTDAEGRVVLADALAYGRETFKPDLMIDLATLTGACVVALGSKRAGLFTQDEGLRGGLIAVGESTGDRVWPLPMGEEYDEQIRSDAGLVKNTGGREGGACTAASFLEHWAGDARWAHIDIAGPAMGGKDAPHLEKGATGFGVRLVAEFLRRHAAGLPRRQKTPAGAKRRKAA
ncbi:MAG: leucyl aminopeptidase [Verrucomicrobia bacterium]|nr:leucyl aminopeptidase [Verrucomicrobiota bacterium]MBI3868984.1 leucyl aminopeptidase [Verrucomicrobiota bacterium]